MQGCKDNKCMIFFSRAVKLQLSIRCVALLCIGIMSGKKSFKSLRVH